MSKSVAPVAVVRTIPFKVYGPDMDCIGWDFMDIDESILVNGHPIDRGDW